MDRVRAVLLVLMVLGPLGPARGGGADGLLVGVTRDYPPYEYLDEDQRPAGFDVDLFRAVAEESGLQVEFVTGPWIQVRQDLEEGRVHAVTGMFSSPERDRLVDFSEPFLTVSHRIFVRKGTAIRTLDDVRDREVLVQKGEIMHDLVSTTSLTYKVTTVESHLDALRILSSGKCDCALLDELQGRYLVRVHGLDNLEAVGEPIASSRYCFAVREGDDALRDRLNEGLRVVNASGRYGEIYRKWFGVVEEERFAVRMWRFAAAMAIPFSIIVVIMLLWSWTLRRTVKVRTEELSRKVSECERAEDAVRDSEALYRAIFEHTGNASILINKDTTIALTNTQWTALTGYTREECEGIRSWTEFVVPEDLERMKAYHAARRNDPADAPKIYEFRLIDRAGTVHDCINHVGMIPGTDRSVASILDITERKRAEEALHESQRMLSHTIEFLPDPTLVIDRQGKVVSWNRAIADMTGIPAENMIGRGEYEYALPFYGERRPILIDLVLAPGKSLEANYSDIHRHRDVLIAEAYVPGLPGGRRFLSGKAAVIRNMKGEIVGAIETIRDITEKKLAQEALREAHDLLEERVAMRTAELREANEELKKFAYFVSHDLRAPLINLKGFSAELRSTLDDIRPALEGSQVEAEERGRIEKAFQEDIPEALGFIETSVTRMDGLINAVLQLSRAGRRPLDRERVDMKALTETIIRSMEHQIEERRVAVQVGELPDVVADRISMEQIMGNLIDNAVKYLSPERRGEVSISGERTQDAAVFHVHDNGRGISREDAPRVFELFRRVGAQDVPGFGMGLNYVQALVRRHGGRIWCESEPGEGTTFSFTITEAAGQEGEGDDRS